MHISDKFIIREIAGEHIIVPTGNEALRFQGLITVNEIGAFLWETLQGGDKTLEELVQAVCAEYEADPGEAERDTKEFLGKIQNEGMLIG